MRDLVLVTAHCPSEDQEKMLERCIDSIIKFGHHVLLISHTHVPIHIQKKCNYYFFDYYNDVNHNDDLLYFTSYDFQNGSSVRSKYFNKEFYGFAIYRMFSIASQVAINFKYRNIHHIEYDCVLYDNTLIEEHNNLLEQYDSVFYNIPGDSTGFILGSFKSFKVESLPELYKNYNRDTMEDMMINGPILPLESFTKHIFLDSGKPCFRKLSDLDGRFLKDDTSLRLKHFVPYYDHRTDEFFLFYKNYDNTPHELRMYVNGVNTLDVFVRPKFWAVRYLSKYDDLKSLMLVLGNKIIYDKSFDKEGLQKLKENSYIIVNEKNN